MATPPVVVKAAREDEVMMATVLDDRFVTLDSLFFNASFPFLLTWETWA